MLKNEEKRGKEKKLLGDLLSTLMGPFEDGRTSSKKRKPSIRERGEVVGEGELGLELGLGWP